MISGIDISQYQGSAFNTEKAKAEGFDFCICRLGGGLPGFNQDKYFLDNYINCKEQGLKVGAYVYANGLNEENYFLDVFAYETASRLDTLQLEYPVFLDVEAASWRNRTKDVNTAVIKRILNKMESYNLFVGVYSSQDWFKNCVNYDELYGRYVCWVAKWSTTPPTIGYDLWQYGGETNLILSNQVAGVTCDQDYSKYDYSEIIPKTNCNGWMDLTYDVNGDGKVNSKDIVAEMKAVANGTGGKDVNGDGKVNSKDIVKIMKEIADK